MRPTGRTLFRHQRLQPVRTYPLVSKLGLLVENAMASRESTPGQDQGRSASQSEIAGPSDGITRTPPSQDACYTGGLVWDLGSDPTHRSQETDELRIRQSTIYKFKFESRIARRYPPPIWKILCEIEPYSCKSNYPTARLSLRALLSLRNVGAHMANLLQKKHRDGHHSRASPKATYRYALSTLSHKKPPPSYLFTHSSQYRVRPVHHSSEKSRRRIETAVGYLTAVGKDAPVAPRSRDCLGRRTYSFYVNVYGCS
jgi:hypothetical protein